MQQTQADPLVDALVKDFGATTCSPSTSWSSIAATRRWSASWRQHSTGSSARPEVSRQPTPPKPAGPHSRLAPRRVGHTRPRRRAATALTPATAPAALPARLVRQERPPPSSATRARALAVPAILPGDIAQPDPRRRPAHRREHGGEPQVPTATSIRSIPVRTLEENRRILNKHREPTAAVKVSFTHLVAWAILRALDTFPRLNDAYAELEGSRTASSATRSASGIAVDVQKKDGTRTLLVPNIKDAGRLDFARVPEGLRRARRALAQGHDLPRRLHGHDGLAHQPRHRRHHRRPRRA